MALNISDEMLGIFVPIVVYWVYSGIYGIYMLFGSFDNYRLHPRKEEEEKNLVPKSVVVRGVLLQQALQVIVAMIMFKIENATRSTAPTTIQNLSWMRVVGQFLIAMVVFDSWEYFMHRYLHHNKYLYKHIHSYHHCLVVPYAFGTLYNHPIEGLLMDSMGGAATFLVSGMSPRTSIFFFTFTTIKAIDDHCGLLLPGNLFQLLFKNNCAYHDIHHQLYGGKGNFAQPYFVFWDWVLGTHIPFTLEKTVEGGFHARPIKDYEKNLKNK